MKLRLAALSLALACTATAALAATANNFVLLRDGHPIGRASYTIDKTKDGYHVKAHFEYRLAAPIDRVLDGNSDPGRPSGLITDAQFINDYKVDANGNFLSGYTQNAATQTITGFQPDKQRNNVTISRMQGGTGLGSTTLAMPRPDYLVAPDFDPSAIQVFLTTALAHPHSDSMYAFIVPQTGMGGIANGSIASKAPTTSYINVGMQPASATDAKGTLDGKPVALKHYVLQYYGDKTADLYLDADGNLMEADMGPLQAKYIRAKFALAAQ